MNPLIAAALGLAFGATANDPTQGPRLEDRMDLRGQVTVAARDIGYLSALSVQGCGSYDQKAGMDFLTSLSNYYSEQDGSESALSASQYVFSQQSLGTTEALVSISLEGCHRVNQAVVSLRYSNPLIGDVLSLYKPKGN